MCANIIFFFDGLYNKYIFFLYALPYVHSKKKFSKIVLSSDAGKWFTRYEYCAFKISIVMREQNYIFYFFKKRTEIAIIPRL